MRGKCLIAGLGALIAVAAFVPSAPAASLVADYQFQGNFSSSAGGAGPISPVGGASFVNESVGCKQAKVLNFSKGSGLQLSTPTFAAGGYSVVMLFRLADLSGYRRIFAPGTSGLVFSNDNGLYDHDAALTIYDNTFPPGSPGPAFSSLESPFESNTYAEVALTVPDSKSTVVTAYFNGKQVTENLSDTAAFNAGGMRFFKDNDGANGTEDSAGAVSRIRIFSGQLTPQEVASTFNSSPIGGGCNPATLAKAAVNGKVKVKKGAHGRFVVLTGIDVSCPAGNSTCSGSAKVTKGAKVGRASVSRVPKKLGKAKLSVAAGKTKAVKVKLSKKGSKALAAKGKLKATISVSLSAGNGNPAVASRTAKLKAP
jgi:Concanavalin A-like lectin/glucanases superfamily